MRLFIAVLTVTLLAGCSGGPDAREARRYAEHQLCPQERPEVCTMEYAPVCALLENGRRQEFASACNACADPNVVAYDPEACP